ncbi:hypothetical protein Hanom_Chr00s007235g01737301 [Helianthus anomalus]
MAPMKKHEPERVGTSTVMDMTTSRLLCPNPRPANKKRETWTIVETAGRGRIPYFQLQKCCPISHALIRRWRPPYIGDMGKP